MISLLQSMRSQVLVSIDKSVQVVCSLLARFVLFVISTISRYLEFLKIRPLAANVLLLENSTNVNSYRGFGLRGPVIFYSVLLLICRLAR